MNDRPKTMAERTARPRSGDKVRQWIRVIDGKISGPDPTVELVGTPLSTALADAQAAGAGAAGAEAAAAAEVAQAAAAGVAQVAAAGVAQVAAAEVAQVGAAEVAQVGAAEVAQVGAAEVAQAGAVDDQPADARGDGELWPEPRRSAPSKSHGASTTPYGSSSKPQSASPKPTGSAAKAKHAFAATRSVARKLALQAIYRWLLNDAPWQDLVKEFGEAEDMPNADPKYFRDLVEGVWASRKSLDEKLTELVDRPVEQLDPVEHSVLLIGLYELSAKPDVPYRVAINEAVGLTKRFGATDGHKFVNAVLDRAARSLRPGENRSLSD